MSNFFETTRPGCKATLGKKEIELPILYFRDDFFGLVFKANFNKVKSLMPSGGLHPVTYPGKKALVAIGAFNYIDTTIGPYGELCVGIPVVFGKKPLPILPLVKETGYKGYGLLIMHLPVTSTLTRDAGRNGWGYPKFVADMVFTNTPEYQECQLSEGKEHILTLRVKKKGALRRVTAPQITYSVKDNRLIKTIIPQKGTLCFSMNHKGSYVKLGNHEVSNTIRDLEISNKPLQSRYYLERNCFLPDGEKIEDGVKSLEGYKGNNREGNLTINFI